MRNLIAPTGPVMLYPRKKGNWVLRSVLLFKGSRRRKNGMMTDEDTVEVMFLGPPLNQVLIAALTQGEK